MQRYIIKTIILSKKNIYITNSKEWTKPNAMKTINETLDQKKKREGIERVYGGYTGSGKNC